MNKLIAYHGDPAIKERYLARVESHREADQLIQGYGYWFDGKGCAVGCTIHGDAHESYEGELGIPKSLAHLEDRIFEGLSQEEARTWPGRFLKSIRPGADLSMVGPRLIYWLLTDAAIGLSAYARPDGLAAIQMVADLYRRYLAGNDPSCDEWFAARAAARVAARVAAHAAARAAADAAARAAADAAAYAAYAAADAADAADAAADAADAAADAAYTAHVAYTAHAATWRAIGNKLIELLEAA